MPRTRPSPTARSARPRVGEAAKWVCALGGKPSIFVFCGMEPCDKERPLSNGRCTAGSAWKQGCTAAVSATPYCLEPHMQSFSSIFWSRTVKRLRVRLSSHSILTAIPQCTVHSAPPSCAQQHLRGLHRLWPAMRTPISPTGILRRILRTHHICPSGVHTRVTSPAVPCLHFHCAEHAGFATPPSHAEKQPHHPNFALGDHAPRLGIRATHPNTQLISTPIANWGSQRCIVRTALCKFPCSAWRTGLAALAMCSASLLASAFSVHSGLSQLRTNEGKPAHL